MSSDDAIVEDVIGERGNVLVHRGWWRGQPVWFQVARPDPDADVARRCALEVETRAGIAHDGLAPAVHSGWLRDGRPFLATLPPDAHGGEALADRLSRAALPLVDALTMLDSVAGALAALHDAGLRHGDIRPESVLLLDGRALLLELPSPGGSPEHMAPERLFGEPPSAASDIYELAALLWKALTRTLPWPSSAGPAARRGLPRLTVTDAGAALDGVIRGGLSAVPERRPPSVWAFVDQVRAACAGAAGVPADDEAPTQWVERDPPPPPAVGDVLGETYRLVRLLGRGGCGAVYEAEHLRLPRRFAVKVLAPDLDAGAQARFRREAEIIAGLDHPHIVKVFDYDLDDSGVPFMVMESLEGETLRERLDRGPLRLDEVVAMVHQVAGAVDAAHARGIIHRDLKPENLFLRQSATGALELQVLDFGISKVLSQNLTLAGTMLGTPGYAAPEQVRGEPGRVGPATDVFALGAIIYEALSGRRPFDTALGSSSAAIFYRTCHEEPAPLRTIVRVAPSVEAVVLGALAKQPEQRPPSAGQLAAALARAASRSSRIFRRPMAAVVGAVIVASAALALATQTSPRTSSTSSRRVDSVAGAQVSPVGDEASAVRILVTPPHARVSLDGETIDDGLLRLSPGEHRLVVSAPGYLTVDRTVAAASVGPELRIRLDRQPAAKKPTRPRAARPPAEKLR